MSTRQKRTLSFRGKPKGFFGGTNQDKRQWLSSAYVFPIFRLASAYPAVYLETPATLVSRLKKALGSVICLENIVRPEAACEVWQFRFRSQP